MERRVGLRGRTDFRVITRNGALSARCRGVELSATGIIVDRGRPVLPRDMPLVLFLELQLPERLTPLFAVARPVRSFGTQLALKFVRISDADRLTLAEHLDVLRHGGTQLN